MIKDEFQNFLLKWGDKIAVVVTFLVLSWIFKIFDLAIQPTDAVFKGPIEPSTDSQVTWSTYPTTSESPKSDQIVFQSIAEDTADAIFDSGIERVFNGSAPPRP